MRAIVFSFALLLYAAPAGAQVADYQPSQMSPQGSELVAVFITAEFCIGSRQPGFTESVQEMKRLLAHRAQAEQRPFSAVGVSLDWSVEEGVEHLKKFGGFDEIVVGRNWFNTAAIQFIWRDLPGTPSTPQVLLLERVVEQGERGVSFGEDVPLARFVGSDQIMEWVQSGAPFGAGPSRP